MGARGSGHSSEGCGPSSTWVPTSPAQPDQMHEVTTFPELSVVDIPKKRWPRSPIWEVPEASLSPVYAYPFTDALQDGEALNCVLY